MIVDNFGANGQRLSDIEITSPIEDGFLSSKNAIISVDHGFNDISVDLSWTLIGYNGNMVMVNIAPIREKESVRYLVLLLF